MQRLLSAALVVAVAPVYFVAAAAARWREFRTAPRRALEAEGASLTLARELHVTEQRLAEVENERDTVATIAANLSLDLQRTEHELEQRDEEACTAVRKHVLVEVRSVYGPVMAGLVGEAFDKGVTEHITEKEMADQYRQETAQVGRRERYAVAEVTLIEEPR